MSIYSQVADFFAACDWNFRVGATAERRSEFVAAVKGICSYANSEDSDLLTPEYKLEAFALNLSAFYELATQVLDADQANRINNTIRFYFGEGLSRQ